MLRPAALPRVCPGGSQRGIQTHTELRVRKGERIDHKRGSLQATVGAAASPKPK
jgi:hypothetical protein